MKFMKLSDYVIRFIDEKMGVKHVFILAGGGWMHLLDSLGNNGEIKYICALHEQGAAIAAEAYGQYTNNIGVTMVTTGPGGTNALTGVAAAFIDSTPMMVISGQVKRADMIGGRKLRQSGAQEVDIIPVVRPLTKYACEVTDPGEIRYQLEKAYRAAVSGRKGPVWLDIPLDVQAADIDENGLRPFVPEPVRKPDIGASVKKLAALINDAKRPLFLAGNGIYLSGAREKFISLAERLEIPVMTTWKTVDFLPDDHPLFAGRPGSVAPRGANFNLQKADLLISVGARWDKPQTAFDAVNFGRKAVKVFVDIDENEISKLNCAEELRIICDAGDFTEALAGADISYRDSGWAAECRRQLHKYPLLPAGPVKLWKNINTYAFIDVLSRLLSSEDLIVPGSSGSCSEITCQAFRVKAGQRFMNNQGLGSMGFGLPAAIGACIASGGRRTVCVNGDGGFMLNIQELAAAARLKLPVKYFILNNGGYGSIRDMQNNHFGGHYVGSNASSGVTLPDFQKVAASYGIASSVIENNDGLESGVKRALDSAGPFICELKIDKNVRTQPRTASRRMPDGSMISMPIEDMWPFLDEEEKNANLRI